METFNQKKSFVMQASHEMAPPVFSWDDVETTAEQERVNGALNVTDIYQVSIDGKTWVCTFERWHGCHAIFYCPMRNNRIAVWFADLGKMAKRVRVGVTDR
jgi:hypothetical protein